VQYKYFNISPVRSRKINSTLRAAQLGLGIFFGVDIDLPPVFFVQSRKDIDKIWRRKTEDWFCAWANTGGIYILHPKVFAKESDHKAAYFWKVLKHEYVHLYYRRMVGTGNPRWLNEGLACYLAKQEKSVPDKKLLLGLNKFFDRGDKDIYGVGYFWTKYLIEKYGKAKLLKLIKTISSETTKNKFNTSFKKIYGFGLTREELSKIIKK